MDNPVTLCYRGDQILKGTAASLAFLLAPSRPGAFVVHRCVHRALDGRALRISGPYRARRRVPRGASCSADCDDDDDDDAFRRAVADGVADDFDRDYYDALKAEFAGAANVRILSRDDYEFEYAATEWLTEFRATDVDALKRDLPNRPVPPGLDRAPLLASDFHDDPAEPARFVARAAEYDPVSGRVWRDPPPDMHLVADRPFSHFRHAPPDAPPPAPAPHARPPGLVFEPLERPPLSDEEEEAALWAACDRMEREQAAETAAIFASHECFDSPPADDLARWAAAAESRGGNVATHESFALPPVAPAENAPPPPPPQCPVPNQFDAVAAPHAGEWTGVAEVVALQWGRGSVQVTRCASAAVESSVGGSADGDVLKWSSRVVFADRDAGEHVEHSSSVQFVQRKGAEDLSPARAVFESGAFVSHVNAESGARALPLSLGPECIEFLAPAACGAVELCMMSGSGERAVRSRFILCARGDGGAPSGSRKDSRKGGSGRARFSHIISIRESRPSQAQSVEKPPSFAIDKLRGSWRGVGVSLHPEFPLAPALPVKTLITCSAAANIQPENVTWTEDDFVQMVAPEEQKSIFVDGSKNQRRSRRVVAAVEHDARRLALCSDLCTSRFGTAPEETHAWSWDTASEIPSGYSPRLGKFVVDYFSVVLPGNFVLAAPAGPAWPAINNSVSLTRAHFPERIRLVAARSAMGALVGAALVTETAQN